MGMHKEQTKELRTKKLKVVTWNSKITIGIVILGIIFIFVILAPLLSPFTYAMQDVNAKNLGTSLVHPFGTDKLGRDLFVRVSMGAGISLLVGVISTAGNLVIGVFYGGIAGYLGKKVDMVLMRIADIISSIPSLLYIILIMLVMGSNLAGIIVGLCVSGWIGLARVVRTEILRLKQTDYCDAAKMSGASDIRVIVKQLLPNAINPIIINVTFMIPQAIFTEGFLSFVGVGISAPLASLGTLIQDARSQIYPMQMIYPMTVLCAIVFAFYMIGIGLEN